MSKKSGVENFKRSPRLLLCQHHSTQLGGPLHAVVPPVCLLSCTTTRLRGVGLCLNVRGNKSPKSRHQCLVSESESHVRSNFDKNNF